MLKKKKKNKFDMQSSRRGLTLIGSTRIASQIIGSVLSLNG
jgi:hypothetical protein